MNKRLMKSILLIFLMLMIAMLTGCMGTENEPEEDVAYYYDEEEDVCEFEELYGPFAPEMWVIEDEETGNKIYLFGSIHLGIPEMFPLPERVLQAFEDSDVLAVETDTRPLATNMEFASLQLELLTFQDGTTLRDNISEDDLTELRSIGNRFGVPIRPNSIFTPQTYLMQIATAAWEYIGFSGDYGIEAFLMGEADRRRMEIVDIEDAFESFRLAIEVSEEVQDFILMSELASFGDEELMKESLELLFRSWVNGTIDLYYEAMYEAVYEWHGEEGLLLYLEYMEGLIYLRNIIMAERAVEFLESGDAYFFVVGVLHFPGEDGVIQLLRDKGFNVERVI
ncbi:MAG: TraB/GumN family protein [Oscillospiraceae bacterium]|nr:TraB/GumN family protein [Oscillospiraceae bacterium]